MGEGERDIKEMLKNFKNLKLPVENVILWFLEINFLSV
jgi:hypothetical protein